MFERFACPSRDRRQPRGLTLTEIMVAGSLLAVTVAAMSPILAKSRASAERTISLKNLVILGEAHACYALDWEGRQFSTSPRLQGTVDGNCFDYLFDVGCPNPILLGSEGAGSLPVWGYFLGSLGGCSGSGASGSCGNWVVYRPMELTGLNAGFGGHRLPSVRGFQEYVEGAYYRPTWFSSLDAAAYAVAKPKFSMASQFVPPTGNAGFAYSSYCNSPAALFDPGVFRRPSAGGYQNPNAGFADAYDTPSQDQCLHPDLKSRMVEHNWLVDPPGETNPAWSLPEPYYFNHGIASKPGVLFFDGSVSEMTMVQAVADDLDTLAATGGVDGLWSRDTPFGSDGYFGIQAYDDTRNSFHMLTTDGILGRDFLRRVPAANARGGVR